MYREIRNSPNKSTGQNTVPMKINWCGVNKNASGGRTLAGGVVSDGAWPSRGEQQDRTI